MWGTKFHPMAPIWRTVAKQHQGSCVHVTVRGELGAWWVGAGMLSGVRSSRTSLSHGWEWKILLPAGVSGVQHVCKGKRWERGRLLLERGKGADWRGCWVIWTLERCKFLKLEEGEAWIFLVTTEVMAGFAYCGVTVWMIKVGAGLQGSFLELRWWERALSWCTYKQFCSSHTKAISCYSGFVTFMLMITGLYSCRSR